MEPLVTLSPASLPGAVRDDVPAGSGLGLPVFGPAALLGDLELRLGLPPVRVSTPERIRRYAERMDLLRRSSSPFYADSARVDRLGTAEAVLVLRDALIEAGWSGARIPSGGPRLDAIAALEACANLPLPPGSADRLASVARELDTAPAAVTPYASLSLLPEEQPLWPGLWRRVFDRLAALGTRIEPVSPRFAPAPPDTDLGRLHTALSGTRATAASRLTGDGSLLALRAETSLELAEAVADLSRGEDDDVLLIRGGDTSALDLALGAQGLSTTGSREPSATQPLLQVLPLALELLFAPKDAQRAIDLLLLRAGPIDPYVGRRMAAVLARHPTVAGPRWAHEKARLEAAADEVASMEPWLEGPAFPGDAPRSAVLETIHRVQRWLGEAPTRLHPLAGHALDHAREVEAAVTASASYSFTQLQLRSILDSIPPLAPSLDGFAAAGRVDHVDDPRLILRSRSTVIWWHFTGDTARRHFSPWRRQELAALSAAGLTFPAPADVCEAAATGWRRAALAANRRLILATPLACAGERCEPHPLWDEIVARLGATAAAEDAVLRRAPDLLRSRRPAPRPLPPLPLPPARPEWRAPADALRTATHSPTSIEELLTCPLRWVLRHRAKLVSRPLASLPDRTTLEGDLGHRLSQELVGSGVLARGPQAVAEAFPVLFDRLVDEEASHLRGPAMSFERDAIRRMLQRAADALAWLLHRVDARRLEAERPVEMKRGDRVLDGRADLFAETGDGQRLVLDLKRKSANRLRTELKEGRAIQLGAYARALGARAAYFSLTHAAAVATDAAAFRLSRAAAGPPVEETWDRVERTMDRLDSLLREGRVPVTGLEGAPELLELLAVPEDQAELHVSGPRKKELQERTCDHCEHSPICGRRWEVPS
jgi:hypothetical protein